MVYTPTEATYMKNILILFPSDLVIIFLLFSINLNFADSLKKNYRERNKIILVLSAKVSLKEPRSQSMCSNDLKDANVFFFALFKCGL